jgi:hypothetical protein
MTSGEHYCEMEITRLGDASFMFIGAIKAGIGGMDRMHPGPGDEHHEWTICTVNGGLSGSGKCLDDGAGRLLEGDLVGIYLNLDVGCLRFYVNGEQHGPGYTHGVTGPVVFQVTMTHMGDSATLLRNRPGGMRINRAVRVGTNRRIESAAVVLEEETSIESDEDDTTSTPSKRKLEAQKIGRSTGRSSAIQALATPLKDGHTTHKQLKRNKQAHVDQRLRKKQKGVAPSAPRFCSNVLIRQDRCPQKGDDV